jgi:hypothetical protein
MLSVEMYKELRWTGERLKHGFSRYVGVGLPLIIMA